MEKEVTILHLGEEIGRRKGVSGRTIRINLGVKISLDDGFSDVHT